jgi:hypothetical protein
MGRPLSGPLTGQGNSPFGTVGAEMASPFGTMPLFRAADGRQDDGMPVSARSPFNPNGGGMDSLGLTVADLLPGLPPEVVRPHAAAPDQPVAISPQAIEAAMSNGTHAVPLFEVYRVCPALFQVPVSPHDPRQVSLPLHRMAGAGGQRSGGAAMQQPAASFSFATPAAAEASPFSLSEADSAAAARPVGSLPPRRPAGAAPAIPTAADFAMPASGMPSLQLPQIQPTQQQQPASPFSFSQEPVASSPAPVFSMARPEVQATDTVAPLPGLASLLSAGMTSPSLQQAMQRPAEPAMPMSGGANDFMSVYTKASAPAVARPAVAAQKPPASVLPPLPLASSVVEDAMRLPLQTLFRGQSPDQLGFDPAFIPAWVQVALPAHLVRDQIPSGRVSVDVGTIIDYTDESFRSVIAHGRRAHRVELPINDVFHALPPVQSTPAAAPQPPMHQPAAMAEPARAVGGLMSFPGIPVAPAAASVSNIPPSLPGRNPAISPAILQALAPFPETKTPAAEPAAVAMPTSFPGFSQSQQPVPVAPVQPQFAAFDPFAPTVGSSAWSAPAAEPAPVQRKEEGLGSEQLFGGHTPPASPAPLSHAEPFAPFVRTPGSTGPLTAPLQNYAPPVPPPAEPVSAPLRVTQPAPAGQPAPSYQPAAVPAVPPPAPAALQPAAVVDDADLASGMLISNAAGANPEQMLLRALLGVADVLEPERVVRLTAELPGVTACICVQHGKAITHGNGEPAAFDFQQQAIDLARGVQSLSTVVGIQGAETFSINSKERLVTFSLVDGMAFGVLHTSRTPVSGLREKITLIAREVAKLLQKRRA